VASELADGDLHAEADAEVRDLVLTRDLSGADLALEAAPPKPPGIRIPSASFSEAAT